MNDFANFDDEIEDIETPCPNCRAQLTRRRPCIALMCDEGQIDEHEEDPINYAPGEAYTECDECRGHGFLHWCPACGYDFHLKRVVA